MTALAARLLALLILLCAGLAGAEEAVPPLAARVTDLTGTLSPEQSAQLEASLQAFEAKKGVQIAVLIVPTTAPESIEEYGLRAAERWQLGRKGVDDGALLVVAKNDRTLRIEVGYGLEGALNDATAKRIISDDIVPRFRQGDFYGGIRAGVERIMAVAEGEALPPPARRPPASAPGGGLMGHLPAVLLVALVVGSLLRALLGRFIGATATGGLAALLAWWLAGTLALALVAGFIAFLFTLLSGLGHYGGWGRSRGWGGWGGGGFNSGGFRGGGGSFGGGGASGRW